MRHSLAAAGFDRENLVSLAVQSPQEPGRTESLQCEAKRRSTDIEFPGEMALLWQPSDPTPGFDSVLQLAPDLIDQFWTLRMHAKDVFVMGGWAHPWQAFDEYLWRRGCGTRRRV
jgi:hypothetical protein